MGDNNNTNNNRDDTPRSLNELLKFSIKYHDTEVDRTTHPTPEVMDEERRKFLQKVFHELTVNEVEELQKNLQILTNPNQDVDVLEEALEQIHISIDNLDNAKDFQTIGGFQLLLEYLKNKNPSLRSKAAEIIGTLVQNDLTGQDIALNQGALPLLIESFSDENANVRKKVIGAISALIRHHQKGVGSFLLFGGLDLIQKGIQDSAQDVQTKSIFLLYNLINEDDLIKDAIREKGLLPVLVNQISSSNQTCREHALAILNLVAKDHPETIKVLQDPSLNLKQKLGEIESKVDAKTYIEEAEHIKILKELCF